MVYSEGNMTELCPIQFGRCPRTVVLCVSISKLVDEGNQRLEGLELLTFAGSLALKSLAPPEPTTDKRPIRLHETSQDGGKFKPSTQAQTQNT
jgi:hypothetical protein